MSRTGLGRRGRLSLKARDVGKPQPEIDHLDGVRELIAPGIALQRSEDQEPGNVEVVQHEQRKVIVAADVVDQLPRRGDGYALGRDDHQVITIGEVHRLEQRIESFLLAEQHCR